MRFPLRNTTFLCHFCGTESQRLITNKQRSSTDGSLSRQLVQMASMDTRDGSTEEDCLGSGVCCLPSRQRNQRACRTTLLACQRQIGVLPLVKRKLRSLAPEPITVHYRTSLCTCHIRSGHDAYRMYGEWPGSLLPKSLRYVTKN